MLLVGIYPRIYDAVYNISTERINSISRYTSTENILKIVVDTVGRF
ncbi:hypothetical protein SEPL_418 [Salmonella phage SE_PL]|nr:hypothetical protein SEPL_418 [Salmonella phage SE_PL]